MKRYFSPLLLLALLGPRFLPASAWDVTLPTERGRARVTLTSALSQVPTRGHMPVRVHVHNLTDQPAQWHFDFRSTPSWQDNERTESSLVVSAGPREERVVEFMVPLHPHNPGHGAQNLRYTASGSHMNPQSGSFLSGGGRGWGGRRNYVALSESLARRNLSDLEAAADPRGRTMGFGRLSLSDIPEDPRGLSGVDVILMGREEWNQLNRSARYALTRWVIQGGRLLLASESPGPIPRGLAHFPGAWPGDPLRNGWGDVRHVPLQGELLQATNVLPLLDVTHAVNMDYSSTSWYLRSLIREPRRPVAFLVLVVIAMAVTLGPVNVLVAFKRKRPTQILWVTPVLSLALSLVMAVVILVVDGFGGSGHRSLTVFLSSEDNLEVHVQEQVSRTGVLLRRNFSLPPATEIQPLDPRDRHRHTPVVRSYRLSRDGEWQGDWFASRSVQAQRLVGSHPSRSRIELTPGAPGAPPVVLSSIDARLETLVLRDGAGNYWKVDNLHAGQSKPMLPATAEDGRALTRRARARTGEPMPPVTGPGVFLALADPAGAPFVDTLPGLKWDTQIVRYTGLVTERRDP